ncbi:unnamed protein product [Blepharisma stoltei]|uniref:FHA domain-containing protein n=1 Tax=Blepharisma stoltei TaxID=1481888 RepID=A0AAU9K4A2_9CILI|nr:unnamed protein product [Blepharisma stoltei]
MNPTQVLSGWIIDLSEGRTLKNSACKELINEAFEPLNKTGYLEKLDQFYNTIRNLSYKNNEPVYDLKLLEHLLLILDYCFIDSYKIWASHFEEFLQKGSLSTESYTPDWKNNILNNDSENFEKIPVKQSILKPGDRYLLGKSTLVITEIKANGNLCLEWKSVHQSSFHKINDYDKILMIGRGRSCYFQFNTDYHMSMHHAWIHKKNGFWKISDNGSRNGVWKLI